MSLVSSQEAEKEQPLVSSRKVTVSRAVGLNRPNAETLEYRSSCCAEPQP